MDFRTIDTPKLLIAVGLICIIGGLQYMGGPKQMVGYLGIAIGVGNLVYGLWKMRKKPNA